MARVIVVTSGKGGVGKTTTSAAFATGLAMRGHKTVVIDFDIGLRNLDLIMGCERRVVYDFVNVIRGEGNLNQALIKDKRVDDLYILPASQTRDKDTLTVEGIEQVFEELKERFDFIVCDSPAGIEHGAIMAMYFADEAIVTEIFPAREEPEPGVSGKLIVDAYLAERPGGPVSFLPRIGDVVARLAPRVRAGDLVLTLGAGDVSHAGERLLATLNGQGEGPGSAE